jgi:hypothetical protein
MVVGDGTFALFCEDRWLQGKAIVELALDFLLLVLGRTHESVTVREAVEDRR